MSADNPNDRSPLSVNLPGASIVAALSTLTTALQLAIESAVFLDRIEIDGKTPTARLEALTQQLLSEVKSTPTEPLSEADETAGMNQTIAIITDITDRIRNEIGGMTHG